MNHLSRNDLGNVVLASRQSEKERKYWLNKLESPLMESRFPFDKKEIKTDPTKMAEVNFEITGELFSKITWIINESDILLHMIILSLVNMLLHKYTGNTDIITGTPIYKQDIEGDFVNTILILRNQLEKNMSFKSLLFQVKETLNEALEHQNYPLEGIFYDLGLPVNKNECQLFDTIIILENIQSHEYIGHVNWNILFSFLRTQETLKGTIKYRTNLFEKSTIQRLISSLLYLMRQVLFNVDMPLAEADAVTEEEKNKLLIEFNDNKMAYSSERTIIDLFEAQVEKSPDRIAVVYEDQKITYRNLNIKANRLAWLLRGNNVQPNNIVGFISQRSIEMSIGILGILKSGAAYLPIDPFSPTNRLLALLKNTAPSHFVLTNETVERHTYMAFFNRASAQAKFIKTPSRPPIHELDLLPLPDRSLVDYEIYNRYIGQALAKNKIVLQGSRGCPYNCAFCHKIWPKKQLTRSAENIFKEMTLYYEMGVRRFAFVDDIFNLNMTNTSKLFTLLIENKLQVELFLALRGDILTPEYIDLMVRAGTVRLTMSLETASERLQKLIGKNLNLERFRKNIEYVCTKYPQVILELNTLHGIPTETQEEAAMTLDFIKSLKWLHFPYVHVLKIYQNTDMEKIALRNGISKEAITKSENLAYHELPETLPFDKSFSKNYQADFFNNYFLSKERLIHVLPYQMKILTEDEIVQKYDSYVPADINSLDDLLNYAGIRRDELTVMECRPENQINITDFNCKLKQAFHKIIPANDALKVLLLDLSQLFSAHKKMLYDIFEPPLGLMYLMSYLNDRLPGKINGKIAKSRVDFNNYTELKTLLDEFKPDVIGVRTLSFFKDFFHRTIGLIRQWGFHVPIIAGGPYITSDYLTVLDDRNIDLLVLGEGEITFFEIIEKIKENNGKLPPIEILKEIPGIVLATPEEKPGSTSPRILLMDEAIDHAQASALPDRNPGKLNQPDDLSYIIFTSGSTGKPNGVMIRHQSVNNLAAGLFERIYKQYPPGLSVSLVAPYIFDASIKQIFGALLLGHTLYIVPEDTRCDGVRLRDFFKKHQVEIIDGTPTHLRMLREIIGDGNPGFSPRHLVIGGEPFPRTLAEQIFAIFNKNGHTCRITNVYGPTECCDVVATFDIIPGDIVPYEILPLGNPMPNSQIYILDLQDRLLPIGVVGELWISGAGLAKGYVNRPELTAEKFIVPSGTSATRGTFEKAPLDPPKLLPNYHSPFTTHHSPIYKTGDLARWLNDGNIEFLGRIDLQVKIRGFRIELGEIQAQLLQHKKVQNAVVIDRKDENGEKYLCAYIAAKEEINEIKEFLTGKLPEYMIPSHFVRLDQIPLTPNGKVDRNALPKPGMFISKNYLPPRDATERKLAAIWANVLADRHQSLPVSAIGILDNFFDLGGNSIKIIKMISEIEKTFAVSIPVARLFKAPYIKDISTYLAANKFKKDAENAELVVLLDSEEKPAKIFAFPPAVGYGISYAALSAQLENYSLYAFNYSDDENKLEKYTAAILEIQPSGPYILLGYSAGGKLCLKCAALLESKGHTVSDIILLDCYTKRKTLAPDFLEKLDLEFNEEIKTGLSQLGLESMSDRVFDQMNKYRLYHDGLTNLEPVRAAIHLIQAQDKIGDNEYIGWAELTCGPYDVHEGFGEHREMMNPGIIEKNAAVIKEILEKPVKLEIPPGIEAIHCKFSIYNLKFFDYVSRTPGALKSSNYEDIINSIAYHMFHPWPTFVGPATMAEIQDAAVITYKLIKSIPRRVFGNNAQEISRYYQTPLNMVKAQLSAMDDDLLDALLARGDFILTPNGFKCLEYNISGNIGGIEIPIWQSIYLKNPFIAKFLQEHHIKRKNENFTRLFFTYLVQASAKRISFTGNEINIAIAEDESNPITVEKTEAAEIYREVLQKWPGQPGGQVIFCNYEQLNVVDDFLFYGNERIHILVEKYAGAATPGILRAFKQGHLSLFNGPVTGLMSNKLGLAVLSENEESPRFSPGEREAIKKYIPWSRKTVPGDTIYKGQKVNLEDFIRSNREALILKPGMGYGGEGVLVGKNTPAEEWQQWINTAFASRKWLVQEYVESVPLIYQLDRESYGIHDAVWGFIVLGSQYGDGFLRLLPRDDNRGVINVKQGASLSVIFEVKE